MERFNIDKRVYDHLIKLIKSQPHTEKSGGRIDMRFLFEDQWLKDTAVISNIIKRKGMWEVQLVFAQSNKPHQLIKRIITTYSNKQKAVISAKYMQRIAAKDARGTLVVNTDGFKVCTN